MLQEETTPTHLPIHTLPQTKESKFNPLVAIKSLGRGDFDHQWLMQAPMDWKGLYCTLVDVAMHCNHRYAAIVHMAWYQCSKS